MKPKMVEIMPGLLMDVEGVRALMWLPDDLFVEHFGLADIGESPEEIRKCFEFFLWLADNQETFLQ